MGNPGTKERLKFCKLDMLNSATHSNTIVDYRKYTLQMLPHLQYLDGLHRDNVLRLSEYSTNRPSVPLSTASTSTQKCPSHDQQTNTSGNQKISPNLSFKDLFLLKRRKKSYPSSSTN